MRREVAAGVALIGLTTPFLTGCDNGTVQKSKECSVYATDGHEIHPRSYPIGRVAVIYNVPSYTVDQHLRGVILHEAGGYKLNVHDMPKLDDLGTMPSFQTPDYGQNQQVAVAISTVSTGEVGFTTGCVSQGEDSNGFPATSVKLPLG
jgi:hypothetical protein